MVARLEQCPQRAELQPRDLLLAGFLVVAVLEERCCFLTISGTAVNVVMLVLCILNAVLHLTAVTADQ